MSNKLSVHSVATLLGLVTLPLLFWNCSEVGFQKAKEDLSKSNCDPLQESCGSGPSEDDDDREPKSDLVAESVFKTLNYTVPAPANQLDVLLVIDTSESMNVERAKLADKLDGLTDRLDSEGIDWRMCHIFTDLLNRDGEALRWSGTSSVVLSSSASTPTQRRNIFRDSLVDLEVGDGDEQGLGATYKAIRKSENRECFRPAGGLAVIVISDEDERSCGARASCDSQDFEPLQERNYAENLVALAGSHFNGAKPFTFHSLVIQPGDVSCLSAQQNQVDENGRRWAAYYGAEYSKASELTGGIQGSVCGESYQSQIENISDVVVETLASIPLECSPESGTLALQIYDSSGRPDTVTSVSLDGNKLSFNPPLQPGARASGNYSCTVFVRPN